MDYRYERKFEVATVGPAGVRRILLQHPSMFRAAYPPRWVNNVYLDTPYLEAYDDNVEGNPDRAKARIRWYGDFFREVSDGILEIKVKRGTVGAKERHDMPVFTAGPGLSGRFLARLIRGITTLPGWARGVAEGLDRPTANRYRREYYLSSDGRFRATIDHDLTFFEVGRIEGGIRERHRSRSVALIEVKYGREADADADRVCSWLPFRVTRHSKYVRGVEATSV
jgi:hypothetical protein